MSWFCEHDWKEISRTYAEPQKFNSIERVEIHIHFIGLIQGLTTILWECTKCHDMRKEEMLGKEVK